MANKRGPLRAAYEQRYYQEHQDRISARKHLWYLSRYVAHPKPQGTWLKSERDAFILFGIPSAAHDLPLRLAPVRLIPLRSAAAAEPDPLVGGWSVHPAYWAKPDRDRYILTGEIPLAFRKPVPAVTAQGVA